MCLIGTVDESLPPSTSYWGHWIRTLYIKRVYNPGLRPSSGYRTRSSKSSGLYNPNSVRVQGYNTRLLSPGYGDPGTEDSRGWFTTPTGQLVSKEG